MNNATRLTWKWGVLAAVAMALLSMIPQARLWLKRGKNWQGSYAMTGEADPLYSAYVNALIHGRPRRNDPYAGRDDAPGRRLPESQLSIQFLPAYLLAIPARLLGLSAFTTFLLLPPIAAFGSSLAIFWLVAVVTRHSQLAAAAVPFVLCLASIPDHLLALLRLHFSPFVMYLPFLRRYLPSVPFAFFWIFCALAWRALTTESERLAWRHAAGAGLVFGALVYSYFYLWTAAAAWLACLALAWWACRPDGWRRGLLRCCGIGALAGLALVPYALLLSHRGVIMDGALGLVHSRAPELVSSVERLGIVVLAALMLGILCGRIERRDPVVAFTASLALMPIAVLNQQIVTGRVLQPFHYKTFLGSYVVMAAVLLAAAVLSRGRTPALRTMRTRVLVCITAAAFGWAILEASAVWKKGYGTASVSLDEAMPVLRRLAEMSRQEGGRDGGQHPVVLCMDTDLCDFLPVISPLAVLWTGQLFNGASLEAGEYKNRCYQYLYYTGVGAQQFLALAPFGAFPYFFVWHSPKRLQASWPVLTPEETEEELRSYSGYVASFNRERASQPTLSYVLTPASRANHMANLDRWYQRDSGERVGDYVVYRVKLRSALDRRDSVMRPPVVLAPPAGKSGAWASPR